MTDVHIRMKPSKMSQSGDKCRCCATQRKGAAPSFDQPQRANAKWHKDCSVAGMICCRQGDPDGRRRSGAPALARVRASDEQRHADRDQALTPGAAHVDPLHQFVPVQRAAIRRASGKGAAANRVRRRVRRCAVGVVRLTPCRQPTTVFRVIPAFPG